MFLCFVIGAVVHGQTAVPNAVVLSKGQTMLDCPVSLLQTSSWTFTTDGTNSNTLVIAVGCSAVTGNNSAYYKTELIGGTICRLTIANVTMQEAGVYDCYGGSPGTGNRSLVTIIGEWQQTISFLIAT